MNIELPYKIGTIVKTAEGGFDKYDKIDHYIISEKIFVVLILEYKTNPRLSVPVELNDFVQRWKEVFRVLIVFCLRKGLRL